MAIRRPWNIAEQSVYSLATYTEAGLNMNICTYVVPVSRDPKLYLIALDPNTRTFQNVESTDTSVLQLLNKQQLNLVTHLGKKSGWKINKETKLEKEGLLTTWKGHKVLDACNAYIELELIEKLSTTVRGDHELFLFQMKRSTSLLPDDVLTFQYLINQGVIL